MAPNSHRDAIFTTLQFLQRYNLQASARTLERETGLFFNMNYFADCFIHGAFDEAEEYISGFTTVHENLGSMRIIHEIRWHKFLKAMDNNRLDEAQSIVLNDFKDFERYKPNIIPQMTALLDLETFRQAFEGHHGDRQRERIAAWQHIKNYLETNPVLFGKILYNVENPYIGGFLPVVPQNQVAQPGGPIGLGENRYLRSVPSWFPRSRRI